ncbi:MAG TPA: class I SAM-dependent methyltransferase, partial [Ignavibacteria bacterium]|nr:class I SAM-dependent methyltransferase [Ignavibacteria bacterium]
MKFRDYFSKQAEEYSKYRPKYPDELFKYLSSLTKEHDLAWDCACGNGQASIGLAGYYKKVIATDASPAQINFAIQHPIVTYLTAQAENSGLESNSADIITAATAIHWIDTEKFYPEANRILKP